MTNYVELETWRQAIDAYASEYFGLVTTFWLHFARIAKQQHIQVNLNYDNLIFCSDISLQKWSFDHNWSGRDLDHTRKDTRTTRKHNPSSTVLTTADE